MGWRLFRHRSDARKLPQCGQIENRFIASHLTFNIYVLEFSLTANILQHVSKTLENRNFQQIYNFCSSILLSQSLMDNYSQIGSCQQVRLTRTIHIFGKLPYYIIMLVQCYVIISLDYVNIILLSCTYSPIITRYDSTKQGIDSTLTLLITKLSSQTHFLFSETCLGSVKISQQDGAPSHCAKLNTVQV